MHIPKPNFKPAVHSLIISYSICTLIVVYFLLTSEQFFHWFLIPVLCSGVLIGMDAVDWLRGRMNIFDPVGIIGLLGFHFFFLAPLLHVSWNMWLEPWIPAPSDWRPWLGGMASLNFLGIILYRLCCRFSYQKNRDRQNKTIWKFDYARLPIVLSLSLIFSALLQIMVYVQSGGIMNYISSVASPNESGSGEGVQAGLIFLFSESFPILAMIGVAAYGKNQKWVKKWPVLIGILLVFFVLAILFGGLRGSRSNTVWALFWAAGIIHFWIRTLNKKHIAIGLTFLVLFMYIYGFYKGGGVEGVQKSLQGTEARAQAEKESGRTWQGTLLGDLARSDVHAQMLWRISSPNRDYEYAWGRTYVAATTILIPKAVMPNKPPSKTKEGTELMHGKGSWVPGEWESSKVYALAGEAMLNFGPLAIPFAFIPLGILVGKVRRLLYTWDRSDTRLLLLPMLVNFCFVVLASDLDNDIFFLFKNSGFPVFVIFMISTKQNNTIALAPSIDSIYEPSLGSEQHSS